MYLFLLILLFLLCIILIFNKNKETFNNYPYNYDNSNKCLVENCNLDVPLMKLECNNVPNFPTNLEPNRKNNNDTLIEPPFNRLAPKDGKYTFMIPELKYDGIYSKKNIGGNKCCWSLQPNHLETYGTNNLLHIPEKYN